MNKNSEIVLGQLRKAKADVERLEKEYRAICECNEKIPGVKFEPHSYQKIYKTCKYHEVRLYHTKAHHAKV